MKFGLHYHLSCHDSQSAVQRYRDTLDQAAYGEALGFESVWPVEQHFDPKMSILSAPLLMLAAVAARTRSLRLGVAIVLLSLSHPVRLAEEVATLDVISNGRVEFGIGRGSLAKHFAGFGIAQAENRERFLEGLDIVVKAWTEERFSYHGRFFNIEDLSVVPKVVQQPHPPIRVAANSLETFELMGQRGLPIFAASQVNPFPKIKELLPVYRRARATAGHPDRGGEDVTVLMPLYVAESQEQVRHEVEPSMTLWLQRTAALYESRPRIGPEIQTTPERLERMRSMTYERARETMAVFDTPAACVERLHRLQEDFNMGRVIAWFNPGGMVPHAQVMRSMELFAAKVMPHFA